MLLCFDKGPRNSVLRNEADALLRFRLPMAKRPPPPFSTESFQWIAIECHRRIVSCRSGAADVAMKFVKPSFRYEENKVKQRHTESHVRGYVEHGKRDVSGVRPRPGCTFHRCVYPRHYEFFIH